MSDRPLYRIVNWGEHFENNRTKALKEMQWVPIKNRMDGLGYCELLDHADGAAHFGAWIAIVQIASTCKVRGDLHRNGKNLGAEEIARISRIRIDVVKAALSRLVDIGWVSEIRQECAIIRQESARSPQASAGIRQEAAALEKERKKEGNGMEGREARQAAAACPPPPLSVEEWSKPDAGEIAQRIASELVPHHWFPSDLRLSVGALVQVLVTAVDPDASAKAIRDRHGLWRDRVEEARLSGSLPKTIGNKAFEWWIRDGFYLQEPKFGNGRVEPIRSVRTQAIESIDWENLKP